MPRENSNRQEFKCLIKEVKSFDLLDIERSNVYYCLGKLLRKGILLQTWEVKPKELQEELILSLGELMFYLFLHQENLQE